MFDYYNLEPLLMWIHSAMCGLMPEWMAFTIEGIAVGVFIMVMYAVLAIILIYIRAGGFVHRCAGHPVGRMEQQ